MRTGSQLALRPDSIFAAFSMPGSKDFVLYEQEGSDILPIQFNKKGFVVHPFIKTDDFSEYFIAADREYSNPDFSFFTNDNKIPEEVSKEEYIQAVDQIKSELNGLKNSKVVFARSKKIPLSSPDWSKIFRKLIDSSPEAFVFLVNAPGKGSWLGASPEVLLNQSDKGIKVSFLAGTMARNGHPVDQTKWSSKDELEHKIVADYFQNELEDLEIPFEASPRQTLDTGSMIHLKSDYEISGNVNLEELVVKIHPNPALLGYPVSLAKKLIDHYETSERGYYCGYIGPVEQNNVTLFVNLRSMRCLSDGAVLYAGGGILESSISENEWLETELKMSVMQNAIKHH